MTIASFDHYTPLGSDPKLSRNYATKEDVKKLQEQIEVIFLVLKNQVLNGTIKGYGMNLLIQMKELQKIGK